MKTRTLVIAFGMAVAMPALAHEEHRELGPHVHGHGTLNIAVESTRVSMELETPGMDIVGFEHDANSADQKAALEKAKQQLADPLSLFKVPAAAQCKLADAKVEIEKENEHGKDHDHDHGDKDDGDHDHAAEGRHNAFHVTYALECAAPANLTSITFDYFTAFTGAKELDVSVVTEKAQNKYEVTRESPVLNLAGAI